MGKNAQKKAIKKAKATEKDATQLMIERVKPVAAKVLAIIGSHKGPMGGPESTAAEYEASYAGPASEILNVYLEHDLALGDTEFVKKLVYQAVEWPFNLVSVSLQNHAKAAEKKAFGTELGDMKFSQLDKILKGAEGGLAPRTAPVVPLK